MNLKEKAHQLRKTVLEMCIKAGTGHVTSCFSCVEIMVDLFYKRMKPEDVFIMSKGQASPLYYAILADKGLISEDELWEFATKEGKLGVHLDHHVNGVLVTSGSLGHGLGIGCGMAITKPESTIYVLLGDAECYEGSVWESAMFAGQRKLNNLVAIVDCNRWGVITPGITPFQIESMFDACRWQPIECDGHEEIPEIIGSSEPVAFIAQTIKGKGIPFMEDKYEWHGVAPQGEDAEKARRELDGVE